MDNPLALDISLERARALHRIWRALNDGDCPKCHKMHAATEIVRRAYGGDLGFIACPSCQFSISRLEIAEIERLFAPAMDAALAIFEEWRAERARAWPGITDEHLTGDLPLGQLPTP